MFYLWRMDEIFVALVQKPVHSMLCHRFPQVSLLEPLGLEGIFDWGFS